MSTLEGGIVAEPAPPRRQARGRRRMAAILDAAAQLFAERGLEGPIAPGASPAKLRLYAKLANGLVQGATLMRTHRTYSKQCAALALAGALTALGVAPAAADQERDIGAQVYQQLKQKGEIIARPNRLYHILDPIAARIAKVADPQYQYPFHFILVHESQPNAFAVPGGNVYVTDSLMKFVKNQEELAGVLCHETSHDIHHDVVNLNGKAQGQAAIIGILGALTGLGNSAIGQLGENLLYTVQTNHFSRQVESNADHKGAVTCAQAGFNPWGLVWLFQRFQKTGQGGTMEMLSDHPTDGHRIADLEAEFKSDPALFGRFSPSEASSDSLSSDSPARFHRS